jgi:hypothetical protein
MKKFMQKDLSNAPKIVNRASVRREFFWLSTAVAKKVLRVGGIPNHSRIA